MKKYTLLGLLLFLPLYMAQAQVYFPKNDGVKEENNNYIAFTNATLHITPNQVIPFGTLLVQHGKIVASGKGFSIPANTVIVDLEGKHLYPSFIDCYTAFGVEKPKREGNRGRSPQYDASREGFYWNDHIRPEVKSIEKFKYNSKDAEELRKLGFGVINTHLMDGIARGTGVLVALNDEGGDAIRILEDASGQYFSFEKSVTSNQSYPTSLMGAMALLRQMYYDRDWYAKGTSETKDLSLEALIENRNLPAFFEAGDKGNDVRADGIGNLFNIDYIIVGGGNEYETIENIKQTKARYVIPIDFPEAFDVSDPYFAKYIALEDLREWNQAPQNPKVLSDNGINFALTTFDLKKVSSFSEKLEKALLLYLINPLFWEAIHLLFSVSISTLYK